MPLNIPGILVPLHLLLHPRLIVPSIVVNDIRQLDFQALYRAGYRGAVFDKDNCLTVPHEDRLVPELTQAWRECRETFGPGNVLVVSNTAGSHTDAGGIEAESVTYHLSVPVLRHSSLKPSYACIKGVRAYFASLPRPVRDDELVVVGDRLLTDVVMANRMSRQRTPVPPDSDAAASRLGEKAALLGPDVGGEGEDGARSDRVGPLAVWTEGLWKRESLVLRAMEKGLLRGVERWVLSAPQAAWRERWQDQFVRPAPSSPHSPKEGLLRRLWKRWQK